MCFWSSSVRRSSLTSPDSESDWFFLCRDEGLCIYIDEWGCRGRVKSKE